MDPPKTEEDIGCTLTSMTLFDFVLSVFGILTILFSKTLAGSSETLAGSSETLAGNSETLAGSSLAGDRGGFTVATEVFFGNI